MEMECGIIQLPVFIHILHVVCITDLNPSFHFNQQVQYEKHIKRKKRLQLVYNVVLVSNIIPHGDYIATDK